MGIIDTTGGACHVATGDLAGGELFEQPGMGPGFAGGLRDQFRGVLNEIGEFQAL